MKRNKFTVFLAILCVLSFVNIEAKNAVTVDWKDFSRWKSSGEDVPSWVCLSPDQDGICRARAEVPVGESRTFYEPVTVFRQVMDTVNERVPLTPKPQIRVTLRKITATKPEPMLCMVALAQRRRVMLQYPPAGTVWHVPGGVSQLTSVLRKDGHEVRQRWGHIIGLEHLLLSQNRPDTVRALNAIRSPDSNVHDLYGARQILERTSESIQTRDKFKVERNNIIYLSQYQDGTIESAIQAIKNRENNLWYPYFNEVEIGIARDFRPHVYGVSIGDERQLIPGLVLASMVKDAFPETLVVVGGNFWARVISAFGRPEFGDLFNHFDGLVYREGFQPLEQLIATLDPAQASGTVWRRNGEIVVNPATLSPTDFETLPTPAMDGGANQWAPELVPTLYTASNCEKRCGFCSISAASETYLGKPRSMSPRRIAEHMAHLGASKFDIADELFSIEKQFELGRELRRIGKDATWQCYLTVDPRLNDPRICNELYLAGCRSVQLGLESLDPATLLREFKGWNKPANYGRILANLRTAGIHTHVFLMVGIPGEELHQGFKWAGFIYRYGQDILTIKSGRYRLCRQSPEEINGAHSQHIELLPDTKPLHLNRSFRYRNVSNTKIDAVRDILEQTCRRHRFYNVTSTVPWWVNRNRYSWSELEGMAQGLPQEPDIPHLNDRMGQMRHVVRTELKREANFQSFSELQQFAVNLL